MKSYIGKNLVNYKRVSHVNSSHVHYYDITQLTTYTYTILLKHILNSWTGHLRPYRICSLSVFPLICLQMFCALDN